MVDEFKEEKTNRRGCYLLAAGIALALALLAAFGLGLFGNIEGGKMTDLPVMDSGSTR
jgi:hypothetical protein